MKKSSREKSSPLYRVYNTDYWFPVVGLMCGAWRLGSGGRSGGGGLECDTAEGQDQAQEQAWPHYYHTTTLQPLQSAAAPQMGHRPHTAPSPQSSWRGHTRHRMTASPGPGPGLCQVQSLSRVRGLSGVRSEAWWDYTAVSHSRERGLGLVQTTECRSETGLGLNSEHNTDTCHYTESGPGEHSDSRDQPGKDERISLTQ